MSDAETPQNVNIATAPDKDGWDGPPGELSTLLTIMAALRDPKTGCPWDVEQTYATIAPYTIEEAYEVADAIQRGDKDDLCDELGDLLFQVVFYAQMAAEEDAFSFNDVVTAITTKMIRRHPHVFGDVDRDDPKAVKVRWEDIKAQEKAERRERQRAKGIATDKPASALDGVPNTLPPVQRAFKLQAKAARVGFDWPDAEQVIDKVREETEEVWQELTTSAPNKDRIEDEIGDLLFAVVNLARKAGVDPHNALERTNSKFLSRFTKVEDALRSSPTPVGKASLEHMEAAWQKAKQT